MYYWEYSLKHWIELILKKNLILPNYQRFFVWNEKKVLTLIDTFKKNQFVPPVTIGAYKINDTTNKNLILDGQQRLTSILLAYLGIFPDPVTFKSAVDLLANDNDDEDEEENSIQLDNILEWNLNQLTNKGNTKVKILSNIITGNYKSIDLDVDDDFLKNNHLGFCYLVPQVSDEKEQLKYYSSVFRNINIQGEPLLPQESRASLYFLDQDLVNFFAPEFCKTIIVKLVSSEYKADFVRYLACLANYHKNGNEYSVARGHKSKMEKYYEEYIYATINDINSSIYGKFTDIVPSKNYANRIERLKSSVESIGIQKEHASIIDIDVYLFGLIYNIVYLNRSVDLTKFEEINQVVQEKIANFKNSDSHRKSPNNLTHLRSRISESITIYNGYLQD